MTSMKPSERVNRIVCARVQKVHWDAGTTQRQLFEMEALHDPTWVLPAILQYLDEVHESSEGRITKG